VYADTGFEAIPTRRSGRPRPTSTSWWSKRPSCFSTAEQAQAVLASSTAQWRKLSAKQRGELRRMHKTGNYTITDLAELFRVSRPTVYRTLAAAEHVAAQGN
jgi:hypothetical protein